MSLPVREVWIEMTLRSRSGQQSQSLPVREVWIEIPCLLSSCRILLSLPVREVWIEIYCGADYITTIGVTSREGSVD